jgi:hypothetical protein
MPAERLQVTPNPPACRSRQSTLPLPIVILAVWMIGAVALVTTIRHQWIAATTQNGANSAMHLVMMESQKCGATAACGSTIAEITQQVVDAGFAVPLDRINIEFAFDTGRISCAPASQCQSNVTRWRQAAGGRYARLDSVTVTTTYNSVLGGLASMTSTATPRTAMPNGAIRQ